MGRLDHLLEKNRSWASTIRRNDPQFFQRLAEQQAPHYLWIGCSDSRVPANQIIGQLPGDVFVHRNVANVIVHTDLNCLSVVQFAVDVLKVKDIIVCGHYGCGGVRAALDDLRLGLVDNWIQHVRDVRVKHSEELSSIEDVNARFRRLCELNVAEQVLNLCHTTLIRDAWQRGQDLAVHGWVYGVEDGIIKDLKVSYSGQ